MDNHEAERKSSTTGKRKVMVAIDESECSRCALQWALDNLRETIANSDLLIFTVQPIVDFGYAYASTLGAAPPELMRSIQENHQKIASALLEKAKEMCANHGVRRSYKKLSTLYSSIDPTIDDMLSLLGCLKMGENIFISLPASRLSLAWNVLFCRLNPFFETYILNHFRKIGMRSIVELSSIVRRWAGVIFFGSLLQIIPAEMVTEVGDPKEAICAAVEKLNIQLLVLGSHSRGVIKRAFLGSVSNYCVHNAKCPVLVVRKPVQKTGL